MRSWTRLKELSYIKNRWPFAIQCPQLRTCQKAHFGTMHAEYNMYKLRIDAHVKTIVLKYMLLGVFNPVAKHKSFVLSTSDNTHELGGFKPFEK